VGAAVAVVPVVVTEQPAQAAILNQFVASGNCNWHAFSTDWHGRLEIEYQENTSSGLINIVRWRIRFDRYSGPKEGRVSNWTGQRTYSNNTTGQIYATAQANVTVQLDAQYSYGPWYNPDTAHWIPEARMEAGGHIQVDFYPDPPNCLMSKIVNQFSA
jgi:hypothetical protein